VTGHLPNPTVANAPYFEDVAPTIFNLTSMGYFLCALKYPFDFMFLTQRVKRLLALPS